MNEVKILACVVTYNRKELLLRNIKSLKNQEMSCDILILDNCSTDGTYEYLTDNGLVEKTDFYYLKSPCNSGGSGGFNQVCAYGLENNYDYCWLMDDDGYCIDQFTLSEIVKFAKDKKCIYNSLVLQSDTQLTFPYYGSFEISEMMKTGIHGVVKGYVNPYNGTLVSKEILKEIGLPKYDFFIYGDETEFIERAVSKGVTCETVLSSHYYHPVNNPTNKSIHIFGREIEGLDFAPWKLYCFVRNYSYIYKNYKSRKEDKLFGYSMYLKQIINGKNILKSLKIVYRARKDAAHNNFELNIPSTMNSNYKW